MGREPRQPDPGGPGPEVPAQGQAAQEGGLTDYGESLVAKHYKLLHNLETLKQGPSDRSGRYSHIWDKKREDGKLYKNIQKLKRENEDFYRDLLAEFAEVDNAVFSRQLIEACMAENESPRGMTSSLKMYEELADFSQADVALVRQLCPGKIAMSSDTYDRWLTKVTSDPARPIVPITFLYHRDTELMLSVQERASGKYYDWADKLFKAKPMVPRAGLTRMGSLGAVSHFYVAAIGRSGRLHGQYVVTVRDRGYKDAVVALLAYNVDNSEISTQASDGLAGFDAEKGLPAPPVPAATPGRSGRAVELD